MQIARELREHSNADAFRTQLRILHQAAVGVVLCRTREPFRAIDAIRDLAWAENLEFRDWSILDGWKTHDKTKPDAEPQKDGLNDPFVALRAINGDAGREPFGNGFYAMMYPHPFLPKHPGMIQCVKQYARLFAETKRRLVLIGPLGFTLPIELEDDVVILDFDPPSYAELSVIYNRLINAIAEAKRPRFTPDDAFRLIGAGSGMTAAEYEAALSRAIVTHKAKLPGVTADEVAAVLLQVKTEVIKRSEVLELMETGSMAEVGGLDLLKAWTVKRRHCFTDEAREFGIDPPKGIALIGPPGTGKSLAAKAISSVFGIPGIRFDVGRVFNSLVGSSEQRVRAALKMVDGMAPCVLMIDEVDKAFQANSGGGDSGVSQRVLGAILTWMQETKAPVFLVVTANRTDNLPSEFLRAGRLDEVFSVTVPNEEQRVEILGIHLKKRGHDPEAVDDLAVAAERSAEYVPAELEKAVKDALIEAFSNDEALTGALIADQLAGMKPLSQAFADDFARMRTWAENNAKPAASGVLATVAPPPVRTRTRPTGERSMDLSSGLDG